jgi:cGAMP-activated phospholipase
VAEVLASLQAWVSPIPIAGLFSLICGTSVGGIIAVGLALGRTPREIATAINTFGPSIFDDRITVAGKKLPLRKLRGAVGGVFTAKYRADALRSAIETIVGPEQKSLRVRDVQIPFLLVATCATTRRPFIISNMEPLDPVCSELSLVDVMLATAAAPGYFPAVEIGERSLIDGGLVANAPELVGFAELVARQDLSDKNLRVLSIGTAGPPPSGTPHRIASRGLFRWIAGDLVPLTLLAQERLTVQLARVLLRECYWRIDAVPDPTQARVLDLDRADDEATTTLTLLAESAVQSLNQKAFLGWMALQSPIAHDP